MLIEVQKLKDDLKLYITGLDLYKIPIVLLFSHSFHLVVFYRIGKQLSKIPLIGILLRYIFEYIIRIIFASDISLKSTIGCGLKFEHGHDIVIGANVIIGSNIKVFNGVTIGGKDPFLPSTNNQPNIGNNVILSTGSKVLGPITIGDHVIVGANSVVLQNIPSHSIAVGVPAIIKQSNRQ
jgi:serine O-acetyltransferase